MTGGMTDFSRSPQTLIKHSHDVALQDEIRRWKKDLFDSIMKYVLWTLLGEIGVKGLE